MDNSNLKSLQMCIVKHSSVGAQLKKRKKTVYMCAVVRRFYQHTYKWIYSVNLPETVGVYSYTTAH